MLAIREVFVGELGEHSALDWGGDPEKGNVPKRVGPLFPMRAAIIDPHRQVLNWIASGRLRGRRVDWGALAAIVTVRDLREFIVASYGADRMPSELTALLLELDPKRQYALVASALDERE